MPETPSMRILSTALWKNYSRKTSMLLPTLFMFPAPDMFRQAPYSA